MRLFAALWLLAFFVALPFALWADRRRRQARALDALLPGLVGLAEASADVARALSEVARQMSTVATAASRMLP